MSLSPRHRSFVLAPLVGVAIAGAFVGGVWYERRDAAIRDEWADAKLLSSAIDSVRVNALDSLPSDELIRRAVAGMLRELHDPYAALMRPDGVVTYRGTLQGEGRGLGLTLRQVAGAAGVVRVAPGSPGMLAGLRAGDRVLAVDGIPVREGWGRRGDTTAARATQHLLTVWRAPRGDTSRVIVRRTSWHMPAVSDRGMLTDSVAYVRLATMSARSADELEQAVDALLERGATSLVLDLRGNSGGLFEEGVKAAGLFLPRQAIVAFLAGRGGGDAEPHRARTSRWPSLPLTVLVDAGTASAAEVIAVALRDHDRALLVGTPTYGKGVVQRVVTLSKDLSLRLTTARWLSPKGQGLERRQGKGEQATGGLLPDILLDASARRDMWVAPEGWSRSAITAVGDIADSLAMHAVRERWAVRPLPVLEARVRANLAQMVPRTITGAVARAEWATVATQLATVRILEVVREHDALLRYALRQDAALRAGLDVVAPGAGTEQVIPSPLPATITRRALTVPQ